MRGPIVIAGGGPAGALLATYLGRAGHSVTVYESRPDLRVSEVDAGRSINLALATRGIVPLIDIGVIDRVDEITIPMRGRMVHAVDDPDPVLQPYGSKTHEVIHSVGRTGLNAILLDAAEATGNVELVFGRSIDRVDLETSTIHFADGGSAEFGVILGADGAGSPVRAAITGAGSCVWNADRLDHDYKELTLPAGPTGEHQLDRNALHIWPRGEFMLIALANPGGDFTVTLFAPTTTFAHLDDGGDVDAFFAEHFPDFAALTPDLADQFRHNPTGRLATLRTTGWSHEDRAVILGDAAHAIVPFHGQGMNAAMESARALARHLAETPDDVAGAFRRFETERRPNTDAIADMALDNYIEMRAGVIDPDYLTKRALALELEQRHPDHISPRYNMVMFSTMPYAEAQARARHQADLISTAIADPSTDVDALVRALPPLPALDPLADPNALSVR